MLLNAVHSRYMYVPVQNLHVAMWLLRGEGISTVVDCSTRSDGTIHLLTYADVEGVRLCMRHHSWHHAYNLSNHLIKILPSIGTHSLSF